MLVDEARHQQRDVLGPLAQRRQLHRHDVEAVEEVLAKRSLLHHPGEVRVGGGNDPYVHLHRACIADAFELPLLQHAEHLHLQRRGHGADLVEEERALVGLLDAALPRTDRAGEGAAHVTEQLGFEQRLGDRAAVDRDEPLLAPRAALVDRAGHHLFAGAGLARDQHRRAGRRHRVDQLVERPHRRALANHGAQAEALVQLLPEIGVLVLQAPLLDGRPHDVQQLVELEGLGDEVGGAALDDVNGVLHGGVTGDDDRDDPGVAVDGRGNHLASVDARQAQVGNDDVEGKPLQIGKRRFARGGLRNLETLVPEPFRHHFPQRIFVVYEKDIWFGIRHLGEIVN